MIPGVASIPGVGGLLSSSPISLSAIMGGAMVGNSLFNTYMEYQQNQYERDLQKKIFQREDNAVQRRVADLRAAGLSPVLAAGDSASAGPIVNTHAPQSQMPDIVGLLRMENEFETSKVQRELMKAQQTNAIASAYNQTQQGKYAGANAWLKGIEARIASKTGNPGTSGWGKMFNDLFGGVNQNFGPGGSFHPIEQQTKQKNQPRVDPRTPSAFKTKPDFMNQADWELYKENHAPYKKPKK